MRDDVADMVGRLAARAKKRRRPLTYREFSKTTILPAGPLKGHPYDPASDPCQSYLLDQLDAGRWERIFVCTPPQIGGKTTVGVLVPALRNAIALRLPVGYGLPTLQDLDKAWAEKLKPALTGSGYGDHLPKSGPGARGGRGHTLQFTDPETGELEGMLVFLAGGAYGSTVAAAIVDEVDQFRTSDGEPQWGALEDIFARADAYGRKALRIAVGTVENDERSIILPLVLEQGTGTRPIWPCPHCSRLRRWSWADVHYDPASEDSARTSAHLVCPTCAATFTDSDRLRSLRRMRFLHRGQTVDEAGTEIVGSAPRTTSLGLIWTALDSIRSNVGELAVDHLRARGQIEARNDHGLMRKFIRYRLCEPYTGDKLSDDGTPQQISKTGLAARAEASTYSVAERAKEKDGDGFWIADCPPEVEAVVASCDVQRGGKSAPARLYFLLTGFDSSFRTWDLAWGSLVMAPIGTEANAGQLHAGLDRLGEFWDQLATRFERPLIRRGVDVGDRQDEIRQWLIRHPDWWPVKGENHGMKADDKGFDAPGWLYRRPQEGRWHLYHVDVNQARRQAQMGFLVPVGKPGAAHLPRGLSRQDSLITHYCATAEIPDGRGGTRWSEREVDRKHHPDWARRHDLLDCRTYALAMAYQWLRDSDKRRAKEDYNKKIAEQPAQGRDWLGEVGGGSEEKWV